MIQNRVRKRTEHEDGTVTLSPPVWVIIAEAADYMGRPQVYAMKVFPDTGEPVTGQPFLLKDGYQR